MLVPQHELSHIHHQHMNHSLATFALGGIILRRPVAACANKNVTPSATLFGRSTVLEGWGKDSSGVSGLQVLQISGNSSGDCKIVIGRTPLEPKGALPSC